MRGAIEDLLSEIAPPAQQSAFHVQKIPQGDGYYIGRDGLGNPALLVKAAGEGRVTPMRLAGIEAKFGVACDIAEPGATQRTEILSVITCTLRERGVEALFARLADSFVALIGHQPSVNRVRGSIEQLVELFQKIRRPAQRSLTGLIGELALIRAARSPVSAIRAWRTDPEERFDFVAGILRIDAKASTGRATTHAVTFEQANPPAGTIGLFVVVEVVAASGGISFGQFLTGVESHLQNDQRAVQRLWDVVASTLGETLPAALDWCFDLDALDASMTIHDAVTIPALRPPLPKGVTGARFVSDFSASPVVDLTQVRARLGSAEADILPADKGS